MQIADGLALTGASIHRLQRFAHDGLDGKALRAELSSVLALSGRSRRFVGSSERAANTIDAIAAADGQRGAEQRATISTGRDLHLPPRSVETTPRVGPRATRNRTGHPGV
jgi:hypothetical protein